MRLTPWGVRGSLPTPGVDFVRYGGNTTCLQLESQSGQMVILDAGSGIAHLGQQLIERFPEGGLDLSILITHSHSDHIMGFPFFKPLYNPKNRVRVYGRVHYEKSLEDVIGQTMTYSYFPLRHEELPGEVEFIDIDDDEHFEVGDFKIDNHSMNHPVVMMGYRVEADGRAFGFTGDHEPFHNSLWFENNDDEACESLNFARERDQQVVDFFKDCDLLVADSSYTQEEVTGRFRGWGHSSVDQSVKLALDAGIKQVLLTHHEPYRTDDQVDQMVAHGQSVAQSQGSQLKVMGCQERKIYEL